jgi:tetratricopeptide (TPR) repeat protein
MYDGSIVIGTELATDKFDKQISDLDKKISQEEDKKIIVETKLQTQRQDLEDARAKVDRLADAYQRLKQITSSPNEFKKGYAEYGEIVSEFGKLPQIEKSFDKALNVQIKLEQQVAQTELRYKNITDKVDEYKRKIEQVNVQKQKADVDQLKGSVEKVGDSFNGAVKKAGKLALAIFGIRSAYMLLRRASSELSSYDEQYATNLEYIRFVLTQAIAPILRYIVNLAMTLLQYINAILQAWFGVNLFANGSVEAFQKMKRGAGGVAKAVKEIKKQLLGFDEVNMLSSQSDTGTSAGAGGVSMPSMDISGIQGEPPAWLKWIIENKNIILPLLTGIGTALLLIKLGMGGIKALGIGTMVAGIVMAIQGLLGYLKDPTWKNFGTIIMGVGLTILGLGVAIGSVPVAVAGAIVLIYGLIIKNWETIKKYLESGIGWFHTKTDEFQNFLNTKLDWLPNKFGAVGTLIKESIMLFIKVITTLWENLFKTIVGMLNNIFTGAKNVLDGIIKIFKGDFKGGFEQVVGGLWQIFKGLLTNISLGFVTVWRTILSLFQNGGQIFNGFKEGILGVLKSLLNVIISGINWAIRQPLDKLNGVLNTIKGINIMGAKPFDGFYGWNPIPVPQIPRLKVGGIINMPNKGTLVGGGSAIGGEAGREGVLPLTDQQAMAELGREIGKNVLVNLTNIMQMNGRVIGREMKQITNTQDFAYNR